MVERNSAYGMDSLDAICRNGFLFRTDDRSQDNLSLRLIKKLSDQNVLRIINSGSVEGIVKKHHYFVSRPGLPVNRKPDPVSRPEYGHPEITWLDNEFGWRSGFFLHIGHLCLLF